VVRGCWPGLWPGGEGGEGGAAPFAGAGRRRGVRFLLAVSQAVRMRWLRMVSTHASQSMSGVGPTSRIQPQAMLVVAVSLMVALARSAPLTGARAGRAIEPRNQHFGVPTLSKRRKATSQAALSRAADGPSAVGEPWHVRNLHVREAGDLGSARLADHRAGRSGNAELAKIAPNPGLTRQR
jgi:hypothetical protein